MTRPALRHPLGAALLTAGLTVAFAVTAGAQTTPTPPTAITVAPAGPAGAVASAPPGFDLPAVPPTTTRSVDPTEPVVPDDTYGGIPSSHYDIGCDEGGYTAVGRKLYCALTDLTFQTSRSVTQVALSITGWATDTTTQPAVQAAITRTAAVYQTELVDGLQLGRLAWFIAVTWAAVTGLRGRATRAVGELALSLIAAGLGVILVGNIDGYLQSTNRLMDDLTTITVHPAGGADAAGPVLRAGLHRAFVEQPYDAINWGGPLPVPCQQARTDILRDGPHGADDKPRTIMRAAGCDRQADFNARPTAARLYAAALTLVASGGTVLLIGLVAATTLVAKLLAAVCFAIAPLTAVAAVIPGPGRELAWRWVTSLVRTVVAVTVSSFVLSLLLTVSDAILSATEHTTLIQRFVLLNCAVAGLFLTRKRLLHGSHRHTVRIAGAAAGAATIGGVTGFAVARQIGPDSPTRTHNAVNELRRQVLMDVGFARRSRTATVTRQITTNTTPAAHDLAGMTGEGRDVTIASIPQRGRRRRALADQ